MHGQIGGLVGGGCVSGPTEQARVIVALSSELAQKIELLEKCGADLASRLTPLLRQEPRSEAACGKRGLVGCSFGDYLVEQIARIDRMIEGSAEILRTLEI